MTIDTKDQSDNGPSPAASEGTKLPNGYTRLPNGIILDKEGKPCRACNTKSAFSAFAAQATQGKKSATAGSFGSISTASRTIECPADVEELGRSSWTLLHSMAAAYPEAPSRAQQSDMVGFVSLFSRLYPCWVCAEDFQAYIARDKPRVESRRDFGLWLCGAHNEVNRKLGKPVFDCGRWEERWRTGPPNGRCD